MTAVSASVDESIATAVERAAAGDEAAFARIVRAHHGDMSRVSFLICGDPDIADEAVQAAWLLAWRKLRDLRDPDRLGSWLVSIAANEARQILRRRRRQAVIELSVDAGAADDIDRPQSFADIDLVNALARLDADDRALLALRYVAGFDSTELARAIGRSPSGTRARLARLLDRLRAELGDD